MHRSVVIIALLKQQLDKDLLDLGVSRRAELSFRHSKGGFHHQQQFVVARGFELYVHSAISNFYFFALRFRATKNPMIPTLRTVGKGGKRAYPVSLTAAGCMHSASMQRHCGRNAALGLPDDHGIHASDMGVGRVFEDFVSQAHGLVEKLFMVHRQIIYGLGLVGHSYFPRGS